MTESNDKKVPALRFKGFTDDWEQRKLGEISNIIAGGDKNINKIKKYGKYPVIANSINKNGIVGYYDNEYRVKAPAVTVTGRGEIGHAVARFQNFTPIVRLLALSSKLDPIFLANSINKIRFFNESTGVPQLTKPQLSTYSIIIPSVEEQNNIGKLILLIEKYIHLQQRKLEQIKLLKKAMLQKILAETDNPYPKLRFFGFSNTWKKYTVNSLFKISRGYVLSTTLTEANKSAHNPYPVYSSQTKNNGLMGYYNKYLYENAITWTTDGANAGTVNYRSGKFYCTNVCGVILSDKVDANQLIAEELNTVSKRYVSYVGNPKLMNNVMANIKIIIPDQYKERQQISQLFSRQDIFKDVYQRKQNVLKILKQFLLQNMFI